MKINDLDVIFTSATPVMKQKTVINKLPGSNHNPIDRLGFDGLEWRIEGYCVHNEDYDDLITELTSGVVKLYMRDGWYYNAVLIDLTFIDSGRSEHFISYRAKFNCETPYEISDNTTTVTESSPTSSGFSKNIALSGNTAPSYCDIKLYDIVFSSTNYTTIKNNDYSNTTVHFQTFDPGDANTYFSQFSYTLSGFNYKRYRFDYFSADVQFRAADSGFYIYVKVTMQSTSMSETTISELSTIGTNDVYVTVSEDNLEKYSVEDEDVTITVYVKTDDVNCIIDLKNVVLNGDIEIRTGLNDLKLYNDVDDTQVTYCNGNLLPDTVINLNNNTTSTFVFNPIGTDIENCAAEYDNISWSSPTISIANDGYIEMRINTLYPIISIPYINTSTMLDTSGTPTVQIALDNGDEPETWYDIDTAIPTSYTSAQNFELTNSYVNFIGQTDIWIRFNCDSSSTMDIDAFTLYADISTKDMLPLKLLPNTTNTIVGEHDNSTGTYKVDFTYAEQNWMNRRK
jgi:hypothetical protein